MADRKTWDAREARWLRLYGRTPSRPLATGPKGETVIEDEDRECSLCGRVKPDVRRRICLATRPLVCDRCFERPGEDRA